MMILPSIVQRRSEVSFASQMIEEDKIYTLFEAARLAPSSMNIQPWRYVYITPGCTTYESVLLSLNETNQHWAKNAPLIIISFIQKSYEFNNTIKENNYAMHDVGMANAFLMLQARYMGLFTHPMGGFQPRKIVEYLQIPAPFEPILVIAVGYPGNAQNLDADLLERHKKPRARMPLSHLVFFEKWPI